MTAKSLWAALAACLAAAAPPAAAPAAAEDPGYTVTVPVDGVRSDDGSVLASLCNDPQTVFCATYRAAAPAKTGETELVFTGVAPGRYVLSAFHDQNGDYQAQVPPEGYAFGNGASFPPTFETASIVVEGDMTAPLTIAYMGAPADAAQGGSHGAPAPDGVERVDVRENGLYGAFYRPETDARVPALILLGGSEGGLDVISSMAPSFAAQGYGVLALAYWGAPGLPQTLEDVPLEYFDAAVDWLKQRPGVDAGAIGVLGWSRGSEAALLLGARNPSVHAVAAIAPSGIVWNGINYSGAGLPDPAWTVGGAPLPYMVPDGSAYRPDAPLKGLFIAALPEADAHPEAEIPVEQINGPVLLISGEDDAVWPSATFAGRIVARLEREGFAHDVENLVYPGAGHVVFVGAPDSLMGQSLRVPSPMMGGTEAADAAAWADDWPRALAFFDSALKDAALKEGPR